jgi:hypothetical protein
MQTIVLDERIVGDNMIINFGQGDHDIVTIALSRDGFVINYTTDWTQVRPLVSGYTRTIGQA